MKKAVLFSLGSGVEERLRLFKEAIGSEYETEIYISDFNHTDKKYVSTFEDDLKYIHVPSYTRNLSFARIYSYLKFGSAVKKILQDIKPDLVYVMLPPNNVAAKCLKYLKRNDSYFIVDIYDLWPESLPLDKVKFNYNPAYHWWKNLRDKSIKRADYIFTECDLYQEKLTYVLKDRNNISTLYLEKNVSKHDLELIKTQMAHYIESFDEESDTVKLAYLGSVNFIIDIPRISEIVRGLVNKGKKVQVHIIGAGEGLDEFKQQLHQAGAEVSYHGKIFEMDKKIQLLSQCDFALNIMVDSVNVGLTTKSIDYLSMGLPLLNAIKGDTWKFVDEYKVGLNNTDGIVNQLIDMMASKEKMTDLHRNALDLYQTKFTPESFKKVVVNSLKGADILHDNI